MLVTEAIRRFQAWLAPRKLSEATKRAYDRDLSVVAAEIAAVCALEFDQVQLSHLNRDNVRVAFATFSEDHARASILRAHSTWNQFFDFLVADGFVEGNPMAAVNRPKVTERHPKPLEGWEDDTAARLLTSVLSGQRETPSAWPERDGAIVATLLATGVRSSELLGMGIGSLEGRYGEQLVRVVGKGSKHRTIPVEPALDSILGRYLESRKARFPLWKARPDDALFVSAPAKQGSDSDRRGGRRMTSNQLYYLLDQSLKAAGLGSRRHPGAMAHAFRHTFGTTLAADGAPVAAIRKLMGHSSINTSQGYIDSLAREERDVASRNRVYEVLEDLVGTEGD